MKTRGEACASAEARTWRATLRTSQPTQSVSAAHCSGVSEAVRDANLLNSVEARTRASLRLIRVNPVELAVLIGFSLPWRSPPGDQSCGSGDGASGRHLA